MTALQKKIFWTLFNSGRIVKTSTNKMTVLKKNGEPVARFGEKTFYRVKRYCKKVQVGLFHCYVIDKRFVLSLNGNNWVKKEYKAVRPLTWKVKIKWNPNFCEPCPPMSVNKIQSNQN